MTFISYAQNYEDVMLWRALSHIEKGFYIDVGAWSPDIDSVTRHFYENGWSGINIEPNIEFFEQYAIKRPRDKSLNVAIGDKEGVLLINFMSNSGLSTAVNEFAEQHKAAGWASDPREVQLTTLKKVCQENMPADQEIHFLKVDVEGLEDAVLQGNDWTVYRPWIVLVEATLPMTQVESYESWEPILLNADYRFAYADGLNRFYLANEHADLRKAFKYPPNVFDSFLLNSQQEAVKAQLRERSDELAAQVDASKREAHRSQLAHEALRDKLEAQVDDSKREAHRWWLAHEALRDKLEAIERSRSWRLVRSLSVIRRFAASSLGWLKSALRLLILKAIKVVFAAPGLRRGLKPLLARFPFIYSRLHRMAMHEQIIGIDRQQLSSVEGNERDHTVVYLDKRASRVLADLKHSRNGRASQ